ncbi:hypothetical protein ASF84_05505 [Pseudomonas sp. Leaf127]|uniref:DUF2163 domain-containing protein n=1 Tax=Pseudomonas sp. Leaf127 TaxID=1736267 RepID=UPI0007035D36|nr:DUF2163 domain-containing protein [Pseudomonas sp. Leaf127]KQQ60163.1 hypothetical protein ASF84_05505 [Pseudomonas sp. Leaf127]
MRTMPAALKAHLQQSVTSTCRLLKLILRDGQVFGLTTLDRNVDYQGVTYIAINGFDPSVIATDTGLSVDNAEASALLAVEVPGITFEMALAGDLDDASWELMLVNWADLSMGHLVIDAGDVGEVNVQGTEIYVPELLSYVMRLKQNIGHVWSRRCRAVFGSEGRGQTGCGVDASGMWRAGEVSAVGDEPRAVFAAAGLSLDQEPVPGRLRWITGPNRSTTRLYQVEAWSAVSHTIALLEPVPFTIEPGHQFEIRRDCNKSPSFCIAYGNLINYKGEPFIPVGDGLETMTPSAQVFGGLSGSAIID